MATPDPTTLFYLNGFNYDITAAQAIISANDTAPEKAYTATCQMDLKLSIANHMFQFQIDQDDNINNIDDIKYNFQNPADAPGFELATTHNPGNALMTDNGQDSSVTDTLKNDWLKYLAFKIFGSHLAFDIISNEEAVRASIVGSSVTQLITKFAAIVDYQEVNGSNVPANADATLNRKALNVTQLTQGEIYSPNMAPSKQILDQIIKNHPGRLNPYPYSTYLIPVPLEEGDTIAFTMKVSAATTQLNDLGMSGSIPDRIYLVKMAIVADPN